jgi:hypothetical protein
MLPYRYKPIAALSSREHIKKLTDPFRRIEGQSFERAFIGRN